MSLCVGTGRLNEIGLAGASMTCRLTDNMEAAQVLSVTAHRLIRYGCTEGQATALARVMTLDRDTTDAVVEDAVITALVSAKHAVDGVAEVEYLSGRRCDVQRRLEGR